jgi:hypothetical protein
MNNYAKERNFMMTPQLINTKTLRDIKNIVTPILGSLERMGTSSSLSFHDNDYLMIKLFDSENPNTDFRVFIQPDGLIELAYNDGENDFKQLYGSYNLESYIQFEHDFTSRVNDFRKDFLFSQYTQTFHLSIASILRAQHFVTKQDFEYTPYERHAHWQAARCSRDGRAQDGQRIPHLG